MDLNELIQEVMRLVKSETLVSDIRLRLEPVAKIPRVLGDAILIQQVVLNLVRNAIEAMSDSDADQRELVIRTSAVGSDAVGVAVTDTGRGLLGKSVDELFKPFFTTKPEGLGLGLSISRSIIETEGGRLWATPNPDRGTTLHFTLPVSQ